MRNFDEHSAAMFKLLKDYAEEHHIAAEMSALLLVREVTAEDAGQCRMALQGEDPTVAIQTIHYAAQILMAELQQVQSALQTPEA